MIVMIDNYDSFTYNLYQYIGTINPDVEVYRNDALTAAEVLAKNPSHIIISPGPKYPKDAGICVDLIRKDENIPLLGVCLGHQSIGEAFGGRIVRAPRIMHGKSDRVTPDNSSPIFAGIDGEIEIGRYHSLVIDKESLPECLKVTSESSDGCIMSVEHKEKPIYGIQFHPESVLTPMGMRIIENFLKINQK